MRVTRINVARARASIPLDLKRGYRRHRRCRRTARGRQILCHDDLAPDYAAALARAYNNWAHDYCKGDPQRLKFAAQIAMHDVGLAVEETRRSVNELGAVAIIGTPNPVNGQHLHDAACEPLWNELERLDVPIGFHPTGNSSLKDDAGRATSPRQLTQRPRLRNPVSYRGDRHQPPAASSRSSEAALRVLRDGRWLAGGCGGWRPGRSRGPSGSQLTCSGDIKALLNALDVTQSGRRRRNKWARIFRRSSDYPHADGIPRGIQQFSPPLDKSTAQDTVGNCARLYGIARPDHH